MVGDLRSVVGVCDACSLHEHSHSMCESKYERRRYDRDEGCDSGIEWDESDLSPTIENHLRCLCRVKCVVGVAQNANGDDAAGKGDVEAFVPAAHFQFAQENDRDGGAEDCAVDDDGKDPCKVFGDRCLSCKVALHGEGEYEGAGGDSEGDEDREDQRGE